MRVEREVRRRTVERERVRLSKERILWVTLLRE